MLAKRGVAYNMVVTKISFDIESPTPKLLFKPIGLLPEAAYNQVQEVITSDIVQNILGTGFVADVPVANESAPKQEEAKPAEPPKPKATKPKPEPKPEPKVADIDVSDLNLDDINFDD
jgi:outer membrane biosynthesis protein TonB